MWNEPNYKSAIEKRKKKVKVGDTVYNSMIDATLKLKCTMYQLQQSIKYHGEINGKKVEIVR